MTDAELITLLNQMRGMLISVATGGPRIDAVNGEYRQQFEDADRELQRRRIENLIPYTDLWQWYGKWSSDLFGYASRRQHVAELVDPMLAQIRNRLSDAKEPTGWALVDRQMGESRTGLATARSEEHYQAVGLMCRETLISLAQEVFDLALHPVTDVRVSTTDFKRMIEAYIAVELKGSATEEARRHARTALDLAVRLQHQRTAAFRDAAICVEATGSVVSIIAIVSGRRDP